MPNSPDPRIATMDGADALPRKNGELVFQAPWEGRAFGMVVALNDRAVFAWDEFRDRLKARIAAAEERGEASAYYEHWLESFQALLVAHRLVTPEELERRIAEYASGERDDDYDVAAITRR